MITRKCCSQGDLIKIYTHARYRVCSHKHERGQTLMQRLTKVTMWPWTGKVKVRVTQKGCSQGDLIKVYSHARHCVCSHKHEREQTSTQRLTKMWTDERTDRRILSINKPELLCDQAKNVIIFGTPLFEPFRYYMCLSIFKFVSFLCRLRSIAAHRDHFVRRLSVCPSFCLSVRPSVR